MTKPTPMSGVSVQPRKQEFQTSRQNFTKGYQPQTNYFRPNPNAGPPRFTIEEINNLYGIELSEPDEISENSEFEYPNNEYPMITENLETNDQFDGQDFQENPDENFHLLASDLNNQH